jgi:hypothetical protein
VTLVIQIVGLVFGGGIALVLLGWLVGLVRASRAAARDLGRPTPEEARIHFVYGGKRAEVDRLVEVEVKTIPDKTDAEIEKEINR